MKAFRALTIRHGRFTKHELALGCAWLGHSNTIPQIRDPLVFRQIFLPQLAQNLQNLFGLVVKAFRKIGLFLRAKGA